MLLLTLVMTGCQAAPAQPHLPEWGYAQIRLVDPVDAPQPGQDIVAVYVQPGEELDVRLDLLDQGLTPEADLYLALDYADGGQTGLPLEVPAGSTDLAWDSLVIIPASGAMQVLDSHNTPQPGMSLRVLRDAEQSSVSIRLRLPAQAQRGLRLQAFSTAPGSRLLADRTAVFQGQGAPPPPAPVLFAFWDTYPVYTPATALRRWNGAHTGPLGGSHGLGLLLNSAEQANIPLALLDLNTPYALAAVDLMGAMPRLQRLAQDGLVILPEALPVDWQLQTPVPVGHLESSFAFGPTAALSGAGSPGYALARWSSLGGSLSAAPKGTAGQGRMPGNPAWLPVPVGLRLPDAVTPEGVTLALRRAAVETAVAAASARNRQAAPVLLMGGSLPESAWGNPTLARLGFRYINNHPWIQVLNGAGLAERVHAGAPLYTLPMGGETAAGVVAAPVIGTGEPTLGQNRLAVGDQHFRPGISEQEDQNLRAALASAPDNELRQAARQAYAALSAPVYPAASQLPALRANYTRQVWALLAAAAWAEAPYSRLGCYADPRLDEQGVCILADETIYLQFGAGSGAIQFAFLRRPGPQGPLNHQWIGPSSQLITGLGDPGAWKTGAGWSADPEVIPGAFLEPDGQYQPSVEAAAPSAGVPAAIAFDSAALQKRYTWDGHQLRISYTFKTPAAAGAMQRIRIPLLLDPWERFSPGWAQRYHFTMEDGGKVVAGWLDNGLQVRVGGQGLRVSSFLDALPLLSRPEDPDQDYPPGHYLPFPLALVEVPVQGDFELSIELPGQ